jgi:heterotetrameric sarcosine oxidase gamma subunit
MPDLHADHAATRAGFDVSVVAGRFLVCAISWESSCEVSAAVLWRGQSLPSGVGEVRSGDPRVLCVAPDEWLLVFSRTGDSRPPSSTLRELARQSLAVVDVTPAFRVWRLQGSGVREVFTKSCGLDFDSCAFKAGRCSRTRFANIGVLIDCLEADVFELYVGQSYSAYLQSWLKDAVSSYHV